MKYYRPTSVYIALDFAATAYHRRCSTESPSRAAFTELPSRRCRIAPPSPSPHFTAHLPFPSLKHSLEKNCTTYLADEDLGYLYLSIKKHVLDAGWPMGRKSGQNGRTRSCEREEIRVQKQI
ncbi:unnamed protein product [Cuscuta epithymum]|uniref:Uncharacterized protein n=1 Tax=Cuscuta epithymum TaxID=186058 RepID=A0AAV0F0B6_9ASTE|nr:unnamed protein product [Cuscuta epithymum]